MLDRHLVGVTINGSCDRQPGQRDVYGCARHADGSPPTMRRPVLRATVRADQPDDDLPIERTFSIVVTTGRSSSPAALVIDIVDDVSNAVDDTNSVAEGAVTAITGNVLANDLHPNGQLGADTPTSFVGWWARARRHVHSNPNGTYSYTLNNALAAGSGSGRWPDADRDLQLHDAGRGRRPRHGDADDHDHGCERHADGDG